MRREKGVQRTRSTTLANEVDERSTSCVPQSRADTHCAELMSRRLWNGSARSAFVRWNVLCKDEGRENRSTSRRNVLSRKRMRRKRRMWWWLRRRKAGEKQARIEKAAVHALLPDLRDRLSNQSINERFLEPSPSSNTTRLQCPFIIIAAHTCMSGAAQCASQTVFPTSPTSLSFTGANASFYLHASCFLSVLHLRLSSRFSDSDVSSFRNTPRY